MQKYIPIIAALALSACGGGSSTPAAPPTAVQTFITANSSNYTVCVQNTSTTSALGFGVVFSANGTGRLVLTNGSSVSASYATTWTTTSPTSINIQVPSIGAGTGTTLFIVSNSQISAVDGSSVSYACALTAGTLTTASFLEHLHP
jgi:hypothetical protein